MTEHRPIGGGLGRAALPLNDTPRGPGAQYSPGPESKLGSPSMGSRGPHAYGCSSCLIHDKMSCAEIRDSVRGEKAALASVHFRRAAHPSFEGCCSGSQGTWQFWYLFHLLAVLPELMPS